jgi:hypothetical protein
MRRPRKAIFRYQEKTFLGDLLRLKHSIANRSLTTEQGGSHEEKERTRT